MLRTLILLCITAILGVVAATTVTCIAGLFVSTSTWCGLPLFWLVGFPIALVSALILGFPAALTFRKLGLARWWQFGLGGVLIALPFWFELAQPFDSSRWQQSGFFDSLNYLGSGAFSGLFYWWLSVKRGKLD